MITRKIMTNSRSHVQKNGTNFLIGDGSGTGAVGTHVGTGVAVDVGYEDGAVAEPEGYVCLDAEEGADRLPFPAGGAL